MPLSLKLIRGGRVGVSAYSSLSGRGWGKGLLLFETAAFRMSPHSRGTEGANSRLGVRANKYGRPRNG